MQMYKCRDGRQFPASGCARLVGYSGHGGKKQTGNNQSSCAIVVDELEKQLPSTKLSPQSVTSTEGPAFWFLNNLCIVKTTSEATGGSFSMVYQIAAPGHATPYHVHHIEDEAFYVLDGEFVFICNGARTVVGPGGYMFLPRGIPHGIRVSASTPSTMLILAMPGTGFIGMMQEMAEPAPERVLPVPKLPDFEKLTRLCAKYQIDILGPLPD